MNHADYLDFKFTKETYKDFLKKNLKLSHKKTVNRLVGRKKGIIAKLQQQNGDYESYYKSIREYYSKGISAESNLLMSILNIMLSLGVAGGLSSLSVPFGIGYLASASIGIGLQVSVNLDASYAQKLPQPGKTMREINSLREEMIDVLKTSSRPFGLFFEHWDNANRNLGPWANYDKVVRSAAAYSILVIMEAQDMMKQIEAKFDGQYYDLGIDMRKVDDLVESYQGDLNGWEIESLIAFKEAASKVIEKKSAEFEKNKKSQPKNRLKDLRP